MRFGDLKGKTLSRVEKSNEDRIEFDVIGDKTRVLCHIQNCCESVYIEDICGDLSDLVNSPILLAEEVESQENPPDYNIPEYGQDSFTWTFYKLATNKGSVTIRWYGESTGYYSESVDFY